MGELFRGAKRVRALKIVDEKVAEKERRFFIAEDIGALYVPTGKEVLPFTGMCSERPFSELRYKIRHELYKMLVQYEVRFAKTTNCCVQAVICSRSHQDEVKQIVERFCQDTILVYLYLQSLLTVVGKKT